MKKSFEILLKIIVVIFVLFETISLIYGLFSNTTETLIWIGGMTSVCFAIYGICWLHVALEEKNHIDWEKYPELRTISRWLCFSSWFFLSYVLEYLIFNSYNLRSFPLNMLMLSAFSFWTYFALIVTKKNSLFLLRAYLTTMIFFIVSNVMVICQKPIEIHIGSSFDKNHLFGFIGLIFCVLIISLCIKGFIMTLKPKINHLFKDYHVSYLHLAIVTLIFIGMIRMRNMTITFNHTENSTSQETISTK